jgi:Transposase
VRWGRETSGSLGEGCAPFLPAQGESGARVVRQHRTAPHRRHGPTPDKTDERDALAIARLLLADGRGLLRVPVDDLGTAVRGLRSQRASVMRERTCLFNPLHAQMLQIDPYAGYLAHPSGHYPLMRNPCWMSPVYCRQRRPGRERCPPSSNPSWPYRMIAQA